MPDSLPEWLYYFPVLDSTNNYAMQWIDDGMARDGQVIWAGTQTAGKGQRGKFWTDHPGNLKFTLIHQPVQAHAKPFLLSMQVAVTVAAYLQKILPDSIRVSVKWPNDIFLDDKKACGILIENTFKGMQWNYAVIGIGLNVNQTTFPEGLEQATSLSRVSGTVFGLPTLIRELRAGLMNGLKALPATPAEALIAAYNALLYGKNRTLRFERTEDGRIFEARVCEVGDDGELVLLGPTGVEKYSFGSIRWLL